MRLRALHAFAPVISIALVVAGVSSPAMADDAVDITDAEAVVSEYLSPEVIESSQSSSSSVEVSSDADTPAVVTPSVADEVLELRNVGGDAPVEIQSVDFTLDANLGLVGEESGVYTFADEGGDTAQHVLPTDGGVQIITIADSAPASPFHEFPIQLSEGGTIDYQINPDGSVLASDSYGDSVGTLSAPWAIDANGMSIATRFVVEDGVLSQWVDYSTPGIAYPVLSDPNWTYTLTYVIGPKTKVNATKVRAQFYKCFSCVFAADPLLTGAPKKMPTKGTSVPLRLGGVGNFTVKKGDEWYFSSRNNFGWQFIAQSGHVDGAGSTITFDFYDRYDGKFVQVVNAYIKKDFVLGNATYKAAASRSWAYIANTLNLLIVGPQPGPPPTPPKK